MLNKFFRFWATGEDKPTITDEAKIHRMVEVTAPGRIQRNFCLASGAT